MPDGDSKDDSHKEQALKTVAKSGSFLFVGLIISRFLGYLTRMTLARFLGPGGMGLVYLAASVSGILVTVSIFGLPAAIKKYVSQFKAKDELGKVKGVITSSLKISFPLSLLAGISLFVSSDWLATSIFHKPVLSIALKIFAISIPFRVLLKTTNSSMKGFQIIKYDIYNRRIIEPLSKLLLVLLFIFLGYKVAAGAMGYTAGFIVATLLSLFFLERKVFSVIKTKIKSVSLKRKLIKYSWPLMLTGIIWTIVGQVDTLMIGSLIKEAEPLGIYQAALPTSKFLFVVPAALSSLFLPIISNLLSKEKKDEIKDIYKTTSKWIFYVNFPLLFLFLIFPKAILNILFGNEFLSGGIVLSVLGIGFFVNSFGQLGRGIINNLERTKLNLLNSTVAIGIDIVLNYLLIPIYGIMGAAIATSTTFLIYALLNIGEAYYLIRVQPFNKKFFKSLISAIVAGSLIYWFTNIWVESLSVPLIILSALIFLAIYTVLILVIRGLDENDILILKALERRTGLKSQILRDLIKKFI